MVVFRPLPPFPSFLYELINRLFLFNDSYIIQRTRSGNSCLAKSHEITLEDFEENRHYAYFVEHLSAISKGT